MMLSILPIATAKIKVAGAYKVSNDDKSLEN
jgi:hypothetical protein